MLVYLLENNRLLLSSVNQMKQETQVRTVGVGLLSYIVQSTTSKELDESLQCSSVA